MFDQTDPRTALADKALPAPPAPTTMGIALPYYADFPDRVPTETSAPPSERFETVIGRLSAPTFTLPASETS